MVETSKLPKLKHLLSITNPIAKHGYTCVWCNHPIWAGKMYVRVVWESDAGEVHSDHICVDCWEQPT